MCASAVFLVWVVTLFCSKDVVRAVVESVRWGLEMSLQTKTQHCARWRLVMAAAGYHLWMQRVTAPERGVVRWEYSR